MIKNEIRIDDFSKGKEEYYIDYHLRCLKHWYEKIGDDIAQIEKFYQKFPDLDISKSRWRVMRLSTPSVNPLVDNYEQNKNCGCCADSPIEIWPYKEIDGYRIFASPIPFLMGNQACEKGIVSYETFIPNMKANGVNPELIEQLEGYLERNPPEFDDDEYEDDEWEERKE